MNIGELAKFRGGVSADTISELTSDSGVTIDGVLLKDAAITATGTGTNTLSGTTPILNVSATGSGATAISNGMAGIGLTAGGMNATNKYTPVLKFGSTDAEFTTLNPKFGAMLVGEATQTYSLDTTGGMNLVFFTQVSSPGANGNLQEAGRFSHLGHLELNAASKTYAQALTTSVPMALKVSNSTYTDSATAASGTVAHGTVVSFDNPAIAATNGSVTYTNASTLYIDGAPTAGSNVTITNPYSLYVASGDSYLGGSLGVGIVAGTTANLYVGKNITGATDTSAIRAGGAIQSDVTAVGRGFYTRLSVANASFTLAALRHYDAYQSTIGASATVTAQYGYFADATLIGAATNYGFYSNIAASGTARYNFYAAGTAPNFMGGLLSVGNTATTDVALSTTVAAKLRTGSATYTDNVTAASGTVTHGTVVSFDNPAIAATNASVTYTSASTLYIDGAPTAGSNVTITNPYSLYVANGNIFMQGSIITGRDTITASATGTATITTTGSYNAVAGFGGNPSTITTITAGVSGQRVLFRASSDSVDITFSTGGNIALNGGSSFTLDTYLDTIEFIYDGTSAKWLEVSRSSNS